MKDDHLKIVKILSARKRHNIHIIIEVDPKNYNKIMLKEKLNVCWSRSHVFDAVEIVRCYRCSLFNHTDKDCKNDAVCPRCAGPHKINVCNSNRLKCINCHRANMRLNLNLNTKHCAWDIDCPVHKKKISLKKKTIKYD